jgi:SulP family sulfate permease
MTPDSPPPEPQGRAWAALCRRVPALDALRTYSAAAFGRDLMAGLTVCTVAVPQAMAYAMLAGLPPEYGLYTAIVMTAVGALFDSSRQLINGPTNAISIALLSALTLVPEAERVQAAVALACLVGVIQLGIAFLRLGDLTRFVSHSVIVGFTLGAAALLILDQTKHILGLAPHGAATDHFLTRFWLTVSGGPVHWPTVLVGSGTILIVIAVRQVNAVLKGRGFRFPVPQHLVAVVLMGALVSVCDLRAQGVQVVGDVPSSLPAFRLPELKWEQTRLLAGSAFAIAVLGLLEAIAMAKAIAARTGQRLDVNQQCLSEGAANLAGSFFQCVPGSGSLTRSVVNQQAGAVSQWSGVCAAAGVALLVALFAPLAGYIPRAALAGLLILAAYRMVDGQRLLFHLRATRFDAGVVVVTALAAVLISVEFCIVIGVFLSFALYVPRAAQVRLNAVALPTAVGGRAVAFELEGELFFGAEAEVAKHFATVAGAVRGDVRVAVLVLDRGRNADAGFLLQLRDFALRLRARGAVLVLRGVGADLMACLEATGSAEAIGPTLIFPASSCATWEEVCASGLQEAGEVPETTEPVDARPAPVTAESAASAPPR